MSTPFSLTALLTVWLSVCLAGLAMAQPAGTDQQDPFVGYLDGKPPRIVREIDEPLKGITVPEGVKVSRVVFFSRNGPTKDHGLQDSEVYALIARPTKPGKYPGLLVLHGGGGSAEEAKAVAWAARGYVAIAPDLPGIAKPENAKYSTGRAQDPYGSTRFIASPDLKHSSLFDTVLASTQAFYLLRSQPDVIADRIGIEGISWGGYTTTMICGLVGKDVRAAFSLFGCGYHEFTVFNGAMSKFTPEERERWLKYFDAGRRAQNITAAYFIVAPTNDTFFYPPAVSATLEQIKSEKNLVILPNLDHKASSFPGGTGPKAPGLWTEMETNYFDYHLKDQGQPLPRVTAKPSKLFEARDGKLTVQFSVQSPAPVQSVKVFYSIHGESDTEWKKRKWLELPAEKTGSDGYQAIIPVTPGSGLEWFAFVSDNRPISVSSPMQYLTQP